LGLKVGEVFELGDGCVRVDADKTVVVGCVVVLVCECTREPRGESSISIDGLHFGERAWRDSVTTILCEYKWTAVILVLLGKCGVSGSLVSDVTAPSVGVETVKVNGSFIAITV